MTQRFIKKFASRPFASMLFAPAPFGLAFFLAALFVFAQTQTPPQTPTPPQTQTPTQTWGIDQSTLSYHMSHPMHEVDGVSRAAKGKGICDAGQCNFLIAAPVKSFDSGDTNRDLHMIEATRGAQYPMVIVRAHFPASELTGSVVFADLEVQFAGQTAHYTHVPFQRITQGNEVRITGTVPATCSDFKIDRPSFLTVPIKNEIPIKVDITWRPL